jgi:NAD(P)H dehydrogenase (quinone)
MTKLAVIYYSTTGDGTTMVQHIARAAEQAGAVVRVPS